jgi:ferritin-like metal-binding protein YciE
MHRIKQIRSLPSRTSPSKSRVPRAVSRLLFSPVFCGCLNTEFDSAINPHHAEKLMPKQNSSAELYVEQLRELYRAEIQLVDALPEMIQGAHDLNLKSDFKRHLDQTYRHVERIEQILENLHQRATGYECIAMAGLLNEGRDWVRNEVSGTAKDAALIDLAQRIESYEIASYGCVRIYASLLGDEEAVGVLQMSLNEEAEMVRGLRSLSEELKVDYHNGSLASHRQ